MNSSFADSTIIDMNSFGTYLHEFIYQGVNHVQKLFRTHTTNLIPPKIAQGFIKTKLQVKPNRGFQTTQGFIGEPMNCRLCERIYVEDLT
jgi:hypothetical protein